MNNTPLVEKFTDLTHRIRQLKPASGKTVIVGIGGPGGSGKSTFAHRLSEHLDGAKIVTTDDFSSWDDPLEGWRPRLIEQLLAPLADGRDASYQRYNWTERKLAEWRTITPDPIIILEGVNATCQLFEPYLAYKIWIDCPRDVRLARGLERDGQEAHQQWLDWMAEEDTYIEKEMPYLKADLIVDGNPSLRHDAKQEYIRL